ncbi:hypothetical protein CROQUDRAFT_310858 [Cronartium quercuum f. sp. fusiforme G11]|uniref:CxC6 like cysteine cluster associated with KDZ domain-containing protein n=1 Tax=Cronartium quercuum f. sp. fusiforme G11 TaxID=708437 RepID=A0A9P6NTN9_9BASI|nr:hypothetical protein CROQUDRAFT_310858 [Cronartium quercuum f. sp. fusiforme G11]
MMMVLAWIKLEGSPYVDHICSECTYIEEDPNIEGGGLGYWSMVMDCITIGHPRCSATKEQLVMLNPHITNPLPCEEMLDTPHNWYCPVHTKLLKNYCWAQPCAQEIVSRTKTCGLELHQ